ncbi:MAG: SMC-Scp complex subunit ScpB [Acidobacteriaceae bacterium]
MSLKAKIEAIIYAAEEPISLADINALVKDMVLAEEAAEAARTGPVESAEESPAEVSAEQELSSQPDENLEPASAKVTDAEPPTKKKREKKEPTEDQRVKAKVRDLIEALIAEYDASDRGMEIRQVAGGYRMSTKPEHHDVVRAFAKSLKPPVRLSLAALETLAVIAYKQPVTVPEISEIRGVESAGVIGTLLDRKLITTAGRKQVIGRPILYKTTKEFLLRFGLDNVSELPSMEEFEKIASDGQADLFTAEPSATESSTESAPIAGSGEPATVEPGAEAANAGVPVAEQAAEEPSSVSEPSPTNSN